MKHNTPYFVSEDKRLINLKREIRKLKKEKDPKYKNHLIMLKEQVKKLEGKSK